MSLFLLFNLRNLLYLIESRGSVFEKIPLSEMRIEEKGGRTLRLSRSLSRLWPTKLLVGRGRLFCLERKSLALSHKSCKLF